MIKFSIDEYQNLVAFLKQALLFYANKENYGKIKSKNPIDIDGGSQAQFALDKIKDLEDMYLNTMKEYKSISEEELKLFGEYKNESGEDDDSWGDFLRKIDEISKISNIETIEELKKAEELDEEAFNNLVENLNKLKNG
jgi:hypothetical protein